MVKYTLGDSSHPIRFMRPANISTDIAQEAATWIANNKPQLLLASDPITIFKVSNVKNDWASATGYERACDLSFKVGTNAYFVFKGGIQQTAIAELNDDSKVVLTTAVSGLVNAGQNFVGTTYDLASLITAPAYNGEHLAGGWYTFTDSETNQTYKAYVFAPGYVCTSFKRITIDNDVQDNFEYTLAYDNAANHKVTKVTYGQIYKENGSVVSSGAQAVVTYEDANGDEHEQEYSESLDYNAGGAISVGYYTAIGFAFVCATPTDQNLLDCAGANSAYQGEQYAYNGVFITTTFKAVAPDVVSGTPQYGTISTGTWSIDKTGNFAFGPEVSYPAGMAFGKAYNDSPQQPNSDDKLSLFAKYFLGDQTLFSPAASLSSAYTYDVAQGVKKVGFVPSAVLSAGAYKVSIAAKVASSYEGTNKVKYFVMTETDGVPTLVEGGEVSLGAAGATGEATFIYDGTGSVILLTESGAESGVTVTFQATAYPDSGVIGETSDPTIIAPVTLYDIDVYNNNLAYSIDRNA